MGMIQKKELRIGNLVGHNNPNLDPKYLTVYSIGDTGINFWPNTDEPAASKIEFETIEPIALTPEIFEKGIEMIWNILSHSLADEITDDIDIDNFSLHRFQNLIFDLTGKELEINL